MTCRVLVRRDVGVAARLTVEQISTLVDLALEGDAATFKELARCLGVGAGAVDDLWARTVARRAPRGPAPPARGEPGELPLLSPLD